MKRCPNCGYESDTNFCAECGTPMIDIPSSSDEAAFQSNSHEQKVPADIQKPVDVYEQLMDLKKQMDDGIITSEEFDLLKKSILNMKSLENQKESAIDKNENSSVEIVLNRSESNESDMELNNVAEDVKSDTVPSLINATFPSPKEEKPKSKKALIIGGIAAAVILIIVIIAGSQPKVTSISATYGGYTDKGTTVDSSSPITVTATYDDGNSEEVSGWSADRVVLSPGFNTVTVTYKDQSTNLSIYSPAMSGGKYVATVDEINSLIEYFGNGNIEGFTSLSKSSDGDGIYDFDGVGFYSRMNYTQKQNGENIGVDGSDIPNSVIYACILSSNEYDTKTQESVNCAAAVLTAVDSSLNFNDAKSKMLDCISAALEDGSSSGTGTDITNIDNLKIVTSIIGSNGGIMLICSFQEP